VAKILLIEDELTNQKIVAAVLARHELRIAGTIEHARSCLTAETYDLILLDVSLPDGSGFAFFSEIQPRIQASGTSIIFLTGKTDVSDKVVGFSLGADDYITKPFDPTEFRARVESKLKKRDQKAHDPLLFRSGNLAFNLSSHMVTYETEDSSTILHLLSASN
jgi:two-component system response regulator MtrA